MWWFVCAFLTFYSEQNVGSRTFLHYKSQTHSLTHSFSNTYTHLHTFTTGQQKKRREKNPHTISLSLSRSTYVINVITLCQKIQHKKKIRNHWNYYPELKNKTEQLLFVFFSLFNFKLCTHIKFKTEKKLKQQQSTEWKLIICQPFFALFRFSSFITSSTVCCVLWVVLFFIFFHLFCGFIYGGVALTRTLHPFALYLL